MTRLKHLYKISLIVLLCAQAFLLEAQRKYEWADGWRPGIEHWAEYIVISPGLMGPNALPVPDIYDARLKSQAELEFGGEVQSAAGDFTTNSLFRFYYPVVKNKVGLAIHAVPVEFFKMSNELADKRHTRGEEGYAFGDIYVTTFIKLLDESEGIPDLTTRIAIRTASGGQLNNARFTDTPGYYFDLSFGKTLYTSKANEEVRFYGLLGFYAFQTLSLEYLQNDALLYGFGVTYSKDNWFLKSSLGGYSGYHKNGDKPLVARFALSVPIKKKLNIEVKAEHGVRDFLYNGIAVKLIYSWSK